MPSCGPATAPTPPGRSSGRSWLLIKHRDFWSGALDITTFAPLSVKSEGDFDDILAADLPDVWVTGRAAARGGATGKALREIIEKAAAKKLARGVRPGVCAVKRRGGSCVVERVGWAPAGAGADDWRARSRRRRLGTPALVGWAPAGAGGYGSALSPPPSSARSRRDRTPHTA